MFHDRIIKRIPGKLPPLSGKEKQGHLDDLSTIPYSQLLDLITRQEKLVSNKPFLSKLPDKGEKIQNFLSALKEEQANRNEAEEVTSVLADMKIGSDDVEWSGSHSLNVNGQKKVSQDETRRKNISSSEDSEFQSQEKQERNLTASQVAREFGEVPYVKSVIHKVEKPDTEKQERFKPNMSKKSAEKEEKPQIQKTRPQWEVTAATPPPPVYNDVKVLTLEESLALQKEQLLRLKEAQVKQAQERLAEQCGNMGLKLSNISGQMIYRQRRESLSDSSNTDSGDEEKQAFEEEEEEHENDVAVIVSLIDS
ncbi:DNA-directed RNA polymerase II subunit GRINL1A [Schistocerca piceifrons]|uniref:DNA-directed RNA polymerase II subunit GRINL1A n=1 Tax=Schistocerca piceifrons TaxID=274613 RepID=UPI001F5F5CC1|nr:DNA-directed RNA polymerase II subunit GRINL1A [Schistocerca piceifrons]